ncbi:MAG TPA: 16S rRNA (cytidine(1402)-2'-O)-methyltransferase [Candidatus Baltobacteraceae bacterium]|jgi:16S rRNA (cytidine1402-2'-O)-methyltransferase|nr:16S rRNA (cytidine(1402)-2'-O)-methyltransferase [Candidatus Baltobacteraceae bacterium]
MVRTSKGGRMPLIFVPTPLGNLRDVTLRSLEVLRECTLLVAEDSRVARKLLQALALPGKEIWTYQEHNARAAAPGILERAKTELVAVVTDAGTPGISDPGNELVAAARAAGIPVQVLPGPSALIGAAVLSGFPMRRFTFEGFAPRAGKSRKEAFTRAFSSGCASIWYESPHRVRAALADIAQVDADARVFLLREYTKHFEEHIEGTAAQVLERLADPVRGEIALVVMPSALASPPLEDIGEQIESLLDQGHSVSEIARSLSERGYGDRRAIYQLTAARKRARREEGPAPR